MPAFIVSRLDITDLDLMKQYQRDVVAVVEAYGGRYHVRGAEVVALEGAWENDRMVVLEFADRDAALAWYNSEEYRPLKEMRQKAGDATILLAQGLQV
jgi:uncharacterized protein (DUF1330 family)